ncbi:MAG TPA: SDR family NAD(P)-dependent oxidoreductase [Dehalococcoidia bacterium]|nr:SDR family NAD(P)-dependent oxidoreductase [Dehalococcoidia bacterium]
MKLRNRVVWLIGASSGIGEALVPRLVREGCRLAISARREDRLQEIARGSGDEPLVVALDVMQDGALEGAVVEIEKALGPIDVLFYNAGAWELTEVKNFDVRAFEKQIDTNYRGLVRAIGAVLPAMVERRSGDIVATASLSGYAGFPRAAAYGSTKAAVNSLLQSLRIDLKPHRVGVVTINPGFVDTKLTAENDFPMPFMLEPDEAARAIVAGLRSGRPEIHFPKRLSLPLKALTALPRPAYEWIVGRGVKPR